MSLFPLIMAGAGGLLGAISSQTEANNLAAQVKQQRRQMEDSANNIRALEAKEGAAANMAYNWAASMIRKNRDRPDSIGVIGQGLNQQLSAGADRTSQYRAAAANLMAQRPANIRTQGAWLNGLVGGATSSLGLANTMMGDDKTGKYWQNLFNKKSMSVPASDKGVFG